MVIYLWMQAIFDGDPSLCMGRMLYEREPLDGITHFRSVVLLAQSALNQPTTKDAT